MPAFQAINLEPEENVDDQIDTTKELHVDEALKRFQTALKLHAQGPRSREAAAAAYNELFESEIFKYREARTDYERSEQQANGQVDTQALESFLGGLDIDAGGADGVAATLSLALYLGYKNYGDFFLDKLKDLKSENSAWGEKPRVSYHNDGGDVILENWAKALDQDPSDPEFWRRVARFGAALNSGRLKRFCLEAAIELDDDPTATEVEPPSIAESLAGEQLKQHLEVLGDDIALSHPILSPWVDKGIPEYLKRYTDPISFLPDPTQTLTPPASSPAESPKLLEDTQMDGVESQDQKDSQDLPVSSWSQLGRDLMRHLEDTKAALLTCETVLEAAQSDSEMTSPTKEAENEAKADKPAEPSKDAEKETEKASTEKEAETPTNEKKGSKGSEAAEEQSQGKQPDAAQNEKTQSAPTTRKRSQSAAGLADGAEEDAVPEKRSKRVRRRETIEASEASGPRNTVARQLQPYQEVDGRLFELTKNILENLGMEDKFTLDCIGELQESASTEDRLSCLTPLASKDLRAAITQFSEETARVLLNKEEKASLSLSSFLEHAKSGSQDQASVTHFNEQKGLKAFVEQINRNSSRMTGGDAAFEWVRAISKTYAEEKWSDDTKTLVVQMLTQLHAGLYERITKELEYAKDSREGLAELETLIPMLFELHVDIYERITNPSSVVDYATRLETKDRLGRWLNIASSYVQLLNLPEDHPLSVRFMWASVLTASHADEPVREHMLLMWTSLRDLLTEKEFEPISIRNNVVMPIISAEAADREISKLTTMDFFLGLFQDEMENPVHVIETLEPVLNPSSVHILAEPERKSPVAESTEDEAEEPKNEGKPISQCAGQGLRDLWKFLLSSSTELRLFLWTQLGVAYDAIGYKTKTFSCHLRCIEMIMADLEGETYAKTSDDSRRLLLLRTLKSLDGQLIPALSMGLNDPDAFDIIDEEHIKSSTSALAKLSCLLHVAALCEDEFRLGIRNTPSGKNTFQSFTNRLKEMQVRAWTLQYTLINAAIPQQGTFISPERERADYLSAIHQALGLRKFCKASNKIFLNLMRRELLNIDTDKLDNWEDYLEQVLWDLYGLKLGAGTWEVQDHDCPHEALQKPKTLQLVERVMILANRMPIKDLLKSELRTTIDHMQQTIGQLKSNAQMIHNLRNFTEYLKKPIHPLRLYRALSGSVDLDAVNVPPRSDALLAKHGWFFLLGWIALTKFKGVDLNRRQTPGATDDLRTGNTFLRLQLQFTPDRWDAWFRLAECYDYELDEAVLWTAEKINKDRSELIKFQRHAIHCYTLALSHSRNAEIESHEGDGDPLHDLYHRFGMRMYASSREPFAMEPFQHAEQERFFIEAMGNSTFKQIVHDEMTKYKVWKYAAVLFRMAIKRQPNNWKNTYMLAKCYWKMYTTKDDDLDVTDKRAKIGVQTVLKAIKKSVEVAYNARKSKRSEPILEPHYKIVSVLHKLVKRGDLPAKEAAAILAEQPFGVPIHEDDHFATFAEPEDWEEYIIGNLTKLKDKDKSNWQHRIIMRHATILFDENNSSNEEGDALTSAKAAFNILCDSMLTKTMVMNVWKCDAERPGRHHVYTEQYTRFATKLLVIMSDRTNLEQLLKRIRKKGVDFYHFGDLWQTCCMEYVKLLRRTYEIPDSVEEVFKSMSSDEFEVVTDKITEWAAGEESHPSAFSCMKDAIELKKLNGGLTRSGPIDDLINDCYSKIYIDVVGTLPEADAAKLIEEKDKAKEAADDTGADTSKPEATKTEASKTEESKTDGSKADAPTEGEGKPSNGLQTLLNPDNQDSRRTTPTPQESEKPEAGPRARKTGIRRPDVVRKAEQAVLRSLEPKAGTKSRVGSISSKRGSQTPAVHMSDEDSDDGPEAQVLREAGEGMDLDDKEDEHRPHVDSDGESLHENDGDDESDLSDAPEASDEEMPPGLMFPNLRREGTNAESSGEEADSESEGEEEDEEAEEDDEAEEGAEEAEEEEEVAEAAEEGEEEHDETLEHGHEEEEDEEEVEEGDGDLEMAEAEPHVEDAVVVDAGDEGSDIQDHDM